MLPTCGEGFLKTFNKISRNLKITIKYATQFKKYTTQYSILFLNNFCSFKTIINSFKLSDLRSSNSVGNRSRVMQTMHCTPSKGPIGDPAILPSRSDEKIDQQRRLIREMKRSHAEALKKKEAVRLFI